MEKLILPSVLFALQVSSSLTTLNAGFPCPDMERVCSSTLRVGSRNGIGGSIIDEGPYCTCETCPKGWDDTGDQTLTWYHHENNDWLVQYKFCEPIIPRRTCADNDVLAAVVEADANGWNPRLKSMSCRCPKGFYHLRGWILESHKHWDYHYTCERAVCSEKMACMKHYYTAGLDKTTGYRFLCTCPEGHICPTGHSSDDDDDDIKPDGEDVEGPYVMGYCKKIQSHLKKQYADKLNSANKINKS